MNFFGEGVRNFMLPLAEIICKYNSLITSIFLLAFGLKWYYSTFKIVFYNLNIQFTVGYYTKL